ncbi:hypothetical protein GLV89_14240 [Halomonas alkaliantarctica]|nr:hypothetical protein [Halomonas alkaliantarctica]
MNVDIYQSAYCGDKYLFVPSGTDVKKLTLPSDFDEELLTLSPFKSSLELDANRPRIGLDQHDVINQINEKGFAIHGATLKIEMKK